jgi:hypothetical protein
LPDEARRIAAFASASSYAANEIVTTYLVVHKGQIPCKRYCKLGHQTPYSHHQQPQRW